MLLFWLVCTIWKSLSEPHEVIVHDELWVWKKPSGNWVNIVVTEFSFIQDFLYIREKILQNEPSMRHKWSVLAIFCCAVLVPNRSTHILGYPHKPANEVPCSLPELTLPPKYVERIEKGMIQHNHFAPRRNKVHEREICGFCVVVHQTKDERKVAEYKSHDNGAACVSVFVNLLLGVLLLRFHGYLRRSVMCSYSTLVTS